jgi:Flp pilus assembly protein TadB
MEGISEMLNRAVEELLGRSSGPLHFRLILQPIIASTIAIKAGLRDARSGQPPFLWTFLKDANERRRLIQSGWKDIGKVFIIASIIDAIYQLFVLHALHPLQTLIVAVAVAVVPYVVLRGLTTRLARRTSPKSPSSSSDTRAA